MVDNNLEINAKIDELVAEVEEAVDSTLEHGNEKNAAETIEAFRRKMLGKKGEFTALMKMLRNQSPEDRPKIGAFINEGRAKIENKLFEAREYLEKIAKEKRLEIESLDVTAPGKFRQIGRLHPVTRVYLELRDIFIGMGFTVEDGPEIEKVLYNFEMLNFDENHSARDKQDTFYFDDQTMLRTHTSPVQIRTMLKKKPPLRMICPGRVFRVDEVDATHSPMFNQMEGLVIDKNITISDLIGTLTVFLKELYGEKTEARFRPSYFPFTEPSLEVDVSCNCGGVGCRICKGSGWIEILGSGMVHPNVIRGVGLDPDEYSGFAFGFGIDRIAILKYGISDIRMLFENDLRFLIQF